jgi:hypothetical protein
MAKNVAGLRKSENKKPTKPCSALTGPNIEPSLVWPIMQCKRSRRPDGSDLLRTNHQESRILFSTDAPWSVASTEGSGSQRGQLLLTDRDPLWCRRFALSDGGGRANSIIIVLTENGGTSARSRCLGPGWFVIALSLVARPGLTCTCRDVMGTRNVSAVAYRRPTLHAHTFNGKCSISWGVNKHGCEADSEFVSFT